MDDKIRREIQKSTQSYFRAGFNYLSGLELSKTSQDNLKKISKSRSSLLTTNDVERDLELFSKKVMKGIWE